MTTASLRLIVFGAIAFGLLVVSIIAYFETRINVPAGHIAVLTKKTGEDLKNGDTVAPDTNHKGLQLAVLTEGRFFYNPYTWHSSVHPMVEIPAGKLGVRVRLYGDSLPYGHFLATGENQKGVIPDVLRPGRYAINAIIDSKDGKEIARSKSKDYVEMVELYDPITIPAGFRGVVTNLAGPIPNKNSILSDAGFRGVQKETLDAGTYYLNPYVSRVDVVDCRSQRFNIGEASGEMGFPSRDGFWVSLDGIIEYRIMPDRVAEVLVIYNEITDDKSGATCNISDEIIRKIITPNARSFCRLRGSNNKGRDFIGGDTRTAFQKDFGTAMKDACASQGIEVLQALITRINPPEAIAKPVRDREVARQKLYQYEEQKKQQGAEANLAIEKSLIERGKELVAADQEVNKEVTDAAQKQKVAVTKAEENKAVAKQDLDAAKDQAEAVLSAKRAEAQIAALENAAEAAGWKKAIEALGGDGMAYARYILFQKIAPAYKQMMVNTADSSFMEVFRLFGGERIPDGRRVPLGAGGPNPPSK